MKCEDCIYWVEYPLEQNVTDFVGDVVMKITRSPNDRFGHCHFNPPTLEPHPSKRWATTFPHDFCSQFKKK